MKRETVLSVTRWADTTFCPATISRQLMRVHQEMNELTLLYEEMELGLVKFNPKKLAEESADVVICLYRIIGTLDPDAIDKKMKVNRSREWKLTGDGCGQHIDRGNNGKSH